MSTAYNVRTTEYSSKEANRGKIRTPVSGTVLYLNKVDGGYFTLESAGTFTLEDATTVPLGVEVEIHAQAAVTVNSITLADGDNTLFRVVLNSAGVQVWEAVQGVGSLASTSAVIALGAVNINSGDAATDTALIALLDGLKASGLVTGTFT